MKKANYISTFLKQPVFFLIGMWMVFAVASNAQAVDGWEKFVDVGGTDEVNAVLQTRDEGFLIAGYHTAQFPYIIKTDPDGHILWEQQYGQVNPNAQFKDIVELADGYILAGYETDGSGRDVLVVKINDEGDQLWAETYGGSDDDEGLAVTATSDGGFAVVGFIEDPVLEKQVYVLKMDASGTVEWTQTYGGEYDDQGNAVIEGSDGSLVIAGLTEINSNAPQALLLKVDITDGSEQYFNQVSGANVATDVLENMDGAGGYVLSGYGNVTGDFNAKLIFTDLDGNSGNVFSFGDPTFATEFRSLVRALDGGFVLAGFTETSPVEIDGYMVKTDANGLVQWEKSFGRELAPDFFTHITTTFRGEYVMAGSNSESLLSSNSNFYIVKTNRNGDIFSNYIIGNIFQDLNNDCELDLGDTPIAGWIIKAEGDDDTCYGTSDADGNYEILTGTGAYTIQAQFPNDYWTSCILQQTINFTSPFDTFDLDFAVQAEVPCTDMEVDITTAGLTPGGTTDYLVTYCNNGTQFADDPFVDVEFDESYTIISSNPPFMVLGDGLFRFDNLPDLAPFACGEILITVSIDASSVNGQTHSAKAFAYPNEICETGGDGSHLEVDTECVGDEVELTIRNVGSGMQSTSDFVIVEDMILLKKDPIQLGGGQDTVITVPATGATYRILVDQTAGHVGDSRPSEAIEGCTTGGGFSIGVVNQLPEDDYNHFLSVDCQENQTTLDDESRGYPKGYETEHKIQQCADLKYHHRFTYTGPDTAIRVVIRDTLSPLLDPATVRPGVSNHEYTMDVYGCGILKFTFENIMLNGSSADPSESMVYVKYRVSQRPDNPVDSVVYNSAAAYFDYLSPVNTDTIFHTVADCELESFVSVSTTEIFDAGVEAINVYPNPFVDQATVEVIADRHLEDLRFKLYDMSGRLLRNESFTGMTHQLYRGELISGMYIYKIESAVGDVSSGKLMVR